MMACFDLSWISLPTIKTYLGVVINLLRLKKSAQFCRSSLWFYRTILMRLSKHNPRNTFTSHATTDFYQFIVDFKLDEAVHLALLYYQQDPQAFGVLVVESLWTLSFAMKHFANLDCIYNANLFSKLTNLLFADQSLWQQDVCLLPYLSYLAGLMSRFNPSQLTTAACQDLFSILARLLEHMHAATTSKPVVRETLLVLSNYLAQGMSYSLALEAMQSIGKNASIANDPFYSREILYVYLNFIKIA